MCQATTGRPAPLLRRRRRRDDRRGVILLIAIGMLAMFIVVGVTFVVVARQHKATSFAAARDERYDENHEELLDRAVMQIIRGSNNPHSALGPHSLLEDMYGGDSFPPRLDPRSPGQAQPPPPAEVLAVARVPAAIGDSGVLLILCSHPLLAQQNGYYNGRILTMLNGPARMQSTRIIGYHYNPNPGNNTPPVGTFQVLAFPNGALPRSRTQTPDPDVFLVNGRPFNGTGFGFNSLTGNVDRVSPPLPTRPSLPYALAPNPAAFEFAPPTQNDPYGYLDPAGPGGADEDYDAPDYQNMVLAGRVWNIARQRWEVAIPSLHRPALINYWSSHEDPSIKLLARGQSFQSATFQRKYILRPLSAMHPPPGLINARQFNGGNQVLSVYIWRPDANPRDRVPDVLQNPAIVWDVDNDGDGLADSIWVDLGMPVQTAPDGRQYRPLFAIMVLDMDGKLNLNTMGSDNTLLANNAGRPQQEMGLPYAGQNPFQPATLPVGQGTGVHEINPESALATFPNRPVLSTTEVRRLLYGRPAGGGLPAGVGRYGELELAGVQNAGLTDGARDIREQVLNHMFPLAWSWGRSQNMLNPLVTSDLDGDSRLGLGKDGQPLRRGMGESDEAEHAASQDVYAARGQVRTFNGRAGLTLVDQPFTMQDFVAVLRQYDVDTARMAGIIPNRLLWLLPNLINDQSPQGRLRAGLLTPESYDPPLANVTPTPEMRRFLEIHSSVTDYPRSNLSVTDLVVLKILSELYFGNRTAAPRPSVALLNNSLAQLLPPQLVRGERFDVNYPLGNGRDDNGNNTNDEPGEQLGTTPPSAENVWWNNRAELRNEFGVQAEAQYANYVGIPYDGDNNGQIAGDEGARARQLYARWLYALLMLVKDRGYVTPLDPSVVNNNPNLNTPQLIERELKRRTALRLAQWAVNAVDFRDTDSICTGFEVDLFPFRDDDGNSANGTWDVDGNPATPEPGAFRAVVWGCERPQLLLTETLALHDVRSEDTDEEDANMGTTTNDPATPDGDFDQRHRPEGSLFIELHNPSYEPVAAELRRSGVPFDPSTNAVDLARLSPATATGDRMPVWQLVIGEAGDNPDLANDPETAPLSVDWRRRADKIIWFTTNQPPATVPTTGQIHYTNMAGLAAAALVRPGQYTVIGPRQRTRIRRSGPRLGAQDPNPVLDAITIDLGRPTEMVGHRKGAGLNTFDPNTREVRYPTVGQHIKLPGAIVINQPNPLNISEPRNGYPTPDTDSMDPDDPNITYRDRYTMVVDQPFDNGRLLIGSNRPATRRTIYLQRLANPLLPWNALTNPYLTVDSMPVELTVFNGQQNPARQDPGNPADPNFPVKFASRERNGPLNNIYQRASGQSNRPAGVPRRLVHSLGFLSGFRNKLTDPNEPHPNEFFARPDGVWTAADGFTGVNDYVIGNPRGNNGREPFPWFNWNDRPFISALELLQVPASSPERLLHEFRLRTTPFDEQPTPPQEIQLRWAANHYRDRTRNADQFGPLAGPPFGHLLNFFASANWGQSENPNQQGYPLSMPSEQRYVFDHPELASSNFHRLLELVQVPSRYVGSHTILDPAKFAGNRLQTMHSLHPPFNKLSNLRDPGRVNLNTVLDDGSTLRAILNNDNNIARPLRHWAKVWLSRQGYGPYNANNPVANLYPRMDPNSPTFFANPFRSLGSRLNAPLPQLRLRPDQFNSYGIVRPNDTGVPRSYVESTLLRPDPYDLQNRLDQTDPIGPKRPLFSTLTNKDIRAPLNAQEAAGVTTQPYNDGDRSPYFRYQALTKLGNMVTTRSNVYAIWVTVGFFEVTYDPNLPRALYPDGYVLGQELGFDTGDVTRHRIFCVFDRSKPMAWQRGEDFNVRNGLIVRQIIE